MAKKKEPESEAYYCPPECGTHKRLKVLLDPDVLICEECDFVGPLKGPPNAMHRAEPGE
jgi:hypothetical protein